MVDIKCSFPKSKCRKQARTSNPENKDDENFLRQPAGVLCQGFREAKKSFENGTDEIRQLLMEECCLIYECKICRNMFRNLPDFVCHKRKHCTHKAADELHFSPEPGYNKLTVQRTQQSEVFPGKSSSIDATPIPTASNGDICRVIERFKRVEVSSELNCNKAINNAKDHSSQEPEVPGPTIKIESGTATTQSSYQAFKTHENADNIKTELKKVTTLSEKPNNYFDPDGKANSPKLTPITASTVSKAISPEKNISGSLFLSEMYCEICKLQFSTKKGLKMHVEKSHTSTTYVFQCPTCTMTFLQPAAVIRHLANEHRKPLRRIRKMRDTILKKRIQIGDVQIKEMEREVKSIQLNNTKDKKYNCSSTDQQNQRCISSCSYCSKIFYRRAALATHLMNCLARNVSLNKTESLKSVNVLNNKKHDAEIQHKICEDQNERSFSTEITLEIKEEPQDVHNSTKINNSNTIDKMFENLENQTFGNGLHTVCLENIEMMVNLNESSTERQEDAKEKEIESNDKVNFQNNESDEKKINGHDALFRHKSNKRGNPKRFRVVSASKQLTCRCKICNKQFNALSNLRRHISMFHYRSKRFGCNLCDYRAFRRYDIVNHLTFVHKMSGERESMAIEHVTVHEIKYSKNDVEGDIVLINDDAIASDCRRNKNQHLSQESQVFTTEAALKQFEYRDKNKKEFLKSNKDSTLVHKKESIDLKLKSQVKVVRKKLKKTLDTQIEGKMRPIRNRIKTVNKDFVYDLLTIKDEPKQGNRLTFKRGNTIINDQNNTQNVELILPPVKIIPYRLRTEPLIPADKSSVKGVAENVCRNLIHDGLAAPSTLPELPAERPQMRSRLISASRSDLNAIPVIESSELEAAGLKSTFFDDSFLEKFAKKSNPSFKMKPLLGMQHSPLNSILQKFDASQQSNTKLTENDDNRIPSNYSICLLESLTHPSLKDKDVTPNSKQMFKPSSPPAAPKKRITLMERLVENRTKRTNSFIHTALDN